MKLIVGLGNPGQKFEKTRHNVGFRVIDKLIKIEQITINKKQRKFQSEFFEGKIDKVKLILVKPQTFMNDSGKAVKLLVKNYALAPKNLIIIHDDLDLPLGKIKISIGRGSAGHKGVQSIIDELKTKNFIRFRVGIKPKFHIPTFKTPDKFVLQKFNKEEEKVLKEVIKETINAIEFSLKERVEKAMQEFNK